jgi:subtilisin family serine protease
MGKLLSSASTGNVEVRGGIAPQAQILPIQVFKKSGNSIYVSNGDLLAALEWVIEQADRRKKNGLSPIVAANLSLGGGSFIENCDGDPIEGLYNKVFKNLKERGVLPVVAAGNSGTKTAISSPACASSALSVAATQLDGKTPASYSNFSNQVKLFAIGGDTDGKYAVPTLCSDADIFDCWRTMTGTSPATALVSGGVAALRSLKPSSTWNEIESALTSATGGSSMAASPINGMSRPTLRLTSSGYKLMGMSEPNPLSPSPSPSPLPLPLPLPTIATEGKVCFYPKVNYQGNPNCVTFSYGNWDKWHKISSNVGSVKTYPVNGDAPQLSTKITFFHYAPEFIFGIHGVSISNNLIDTSSLFQTPKIPYIAGVRVQSSSQAIN